MQLGSFQDWLLRLYARHGRSPRPPWFLNFVGGAKFDKLGRGHFENIRKLAAARPDDRVLDVGCGIGRVALHFLEFLDERGRYDGLRRGAHRHRVVQCAYRPRSTLQVRALDVCNRQYNPKGLLDAASFSFPYADASFSLVFATSVLTHLLPDGAAQYLKEIARDLEPGGRSVVTFFIINDASRRHMPTSGELRFQPTENGYWTTQPNMPEAAVAYEEQAILTMYEQAGLEIQMPIRYGTWSGRDGLVGGQDHILATRR